MSDPARAGTGRTEAFLAMVPLDEWWEKDGEILLLGPWCAPYEKHRTFATPQHRTLPSPWQDRARFRAATVRADAIYDRLLCHLVDRLNAACGVRESLAHWRLLVGPWLWHFVHVVSDRRAHLSDALLRVPGLRTTVLADRCFRTPRTTLDALRGFTQDDYYNWQLFSELLPLVSGDTARRSQVVCPPGASSALASPRRSSRCGRFVGRVKAGVLRVMGGDRRAWLTEITASKAELLELAARSRGRIVPAPVRDELSDLEIGPIWDRRRSGLGDCSAADPLEAMCARMLPRHLPTIYLEGYKRARQTIRRRYPRMPSLLVSETGWYGNETFKYLAAEGVNRGVRLVTVQHGSYYGLLRWMQHETFEKAISQTYFVWGWADDRPPLRNLPHPIVSRVPRRSSERSSRLLFAPHTSERYTVRLGSTVGGSLWEPQWKWQDRFVDALPGPVRQMLVLRAPPSDLGQCVGQRLVDRYPGIATDVYAKFKESVARSRLTVLERPGTCLLECLAMNGPTVLFWDPTLWDFRDEARPCIDALRSAGILWDAPESAAAHVAAVYDDPDAWWNSDSVQKARTAFVERFALSRSDWMRQWKRALCEELVAATSPASLPVHVQD